MDLHEFVMQAHHRGQLVVQPRLGVPDPREMAARIGALSRMRLPVVGTLTVDSYSRVGDLDGARDAWSRREPLNGFPLAMHPPEVVQWVVGHADTMPLQVRHGSADPRTVLRAARANGLTASEGGPVSYCLPYSRMPLSDSVEHWRQAVHEFSATTSNATDRPHLETFGGCMLGQMCPPALLVALSILEARFFEQCGMTSISLSYAEQGHWEQDIEALHALRTFAKEYLHPESALHVVQYTYMGVYPHTRRGALALAAESARKARLGGAHRLIVKTVAEAHRLPTLSENISALGHASAAAAETPLTPPPAGQYGIADDARALVNATLELHDDVGTALREAFSRGILDVPFCLHPDNRGLSRSTVTPDGLLAWSDTGNMPLASVGESAKMTSGQLLTALTRVSTRFDELSTSHRLAFIGCGPRALAILERIATRARTYWTEMPAIDVTVIDPYPLGAGRIWRPAQPPELLMNTVCQEVTMFSGPQISGRDEPGAGRSLAEWWEQEHPDTYTGGNAYAPRALYGKYLEHVYRVCVNSLQEHFPVRGIHAVVDHAVDAGGVWELGLRDGEVVDADTIVCATGHPHAAPLDNPKDVGARKDRALHGDSAADIEISHIEPDQHVALIGMGLSFYDLMARFTVGRGGLFRSDKSGQLKYLPSGQEPALSALSRSGLPIPARGRNQKGAKDTYAPALFTSKRLQGASLAEMIDLLQAEVEFAYACHFAPDPADLRRAVTHLPGPVDADHVHDLAARLGGEYERMAPLWKMARPFADITFDSEANWEDEIARRVAWDIQQATLGNVAGPLKSALDVIRDIRSTLRHFVEHGGMSAAERREFDTVWAPIVSLLTAGPPVERVRELEALMRSGIVRICPPGAWIERGSDTGWEVRADAVVGYRAQVDHVLDARVPRAAWPRDRPDLVSDMFEQGSLRLWDLIDQTGSYTPGGIEIDCGHRAVDRAGNVNPALFVVGIPTEGKRWFTQVGSGRPGPWGDFTKEADATAERLLARAFSVTRRSVPRRDAITPGVNA